MMYCQAQFIQLATWSLVHGLCGSLWSTVGIAWYMAVAMVQTTVEIALTQDVVQENGLVLSVM